MSQRPAPSGPAASFWRNKKKQQPTKPPPPFRRSGTSHKATRVCPDRKKTLQFHGTEREGRAPQPRGFEGVRFCLAIDVLIQVDDDRRPLPLLLPSIQYLAQSDAPVFRQRRRSSFTEQSGRDERHSRGDSKGSASVLPLMFRAASTMAALSPTGRYVEPVHTSRNAAGVQQPIWPFPPSRQREGQAPYARRSSKGPRWSCRDVSSHRSRLVSSKQYRHHAQ